MRALLNAPHYPLEVFWDEGSNAFICIAPDLLGCNAVGDIPEEAVKEMEIAMRLWLDAARSMGRLLPVSSLRLAT
jgi:predicted RNase H-like HicB family nuclease